MIFSVTILESSSLRIETNEESFGYNKRLI